MNHAIQKLGVCVIRRDTYDDCFPSMPLLFIVLNDQSLPVSKRKIFWQPGALESRICALEGSKK